MAEIIRVYKEHLPALRLIGKRYQEPDRENGSFAGKWGQWFQNGWFAELEKLGEAPNIENGYLGFMRCDADHPHETFEYWIGMFFPADTAAPQGFESIDIKESNVGVCWIQGKEDDGRIYAMHDACLKRLAEEGMGNYKTADQNWQYFFERYNCPRFTQADANGNIILDYGAYLAE